MYIHQLNQLAPGLGITTESILEMINEYLISESDIGSESKDKLLSELCDFIFYSKLRGSSSLEDQGNIGLFKAVLKIVLEIQIEESILSPDQPNAAMDSYYDKQHSLKLHDGGMMMQGDGEDD